MKESRREQARAEEMKGSRHGLGEGMGGGCSVDKARGSKECAILRYLH